MTVKDCPFPIPMVKKDSVWRSDTEEDREDLAQRMGQSELSEIQACLMFAVSKYYHRRSLQWIIHQMVKRGGQVARDNAHLVTRKKTRK